MSETIYPYGADIPLPATHRYYLTICTYGHQCTLGTIQCDYPDNGKWKPNAWGRELNTIIQNAGIIYPKVKIERYIIMPNHVHMIIRTRIMCEKLIKEFVRDWKKHTNQELQHSHPSRYPVWARAYHCRYIRNHITYAVITSFIHENPRKWEYDKFYSL